jgi:protein-S-isoprenylcysteine O-methyltransferase Ste14
MTFLSMEKLAGIAAPFLIYSLIFILNALLPGRWVTGYVTRTNSNEKLRYHLNGFWVFLILVLIWAFVGQLKILPPDWLYTYRWYGVAGACILGLIFTLSVVLPNPSVRKSIVADIFLGRTENLQLWNGRVDAKMWLFLAGATMLELNALSFASHHIMMYGSQYSSGIIISTALLTFFIADYLAFEEVHLYTYDLFAERIGFKLGWGCIVFYAYFYSVFLWSTVEKPDPHTPSWLLILYVFIFFSGWILSRGANLQKYFFKKNPEKAFLWLVPEAISDGSKTLLVNGFWGLSRHVNYLGEILMSSGMILCTGYPSLIWPWLYPLYYVVLLFTRQMDDDRRCKLKYGDLWNEYKKRVPRRIVPFIY